MSSQTEILEDLYRRGRKAHEPAELIGIARHQLLRGYRGLENQVVRLASSCSKATGTLARRARSGFETARQKQPLQIVMLAAGTGFLIGILLRSWRSR